MAGFPAGDRARARGARLLLDRDRRHAGDRLRRRVAVRLRVVLGHREGAGTSRRSSAPRQRRLRPRDRRAEGVHPLMLAIVLAVLGYGLIAVMAQLELGNGRAAAAASPDRLHLPWLQNSGRRRAAERELRPRARPRRARCDEQGEAPTREPLVLIDGDTGASRPWQTVTPHLEFGFDVLAGVLPRDGSLDGTTRAMEPRRMADGTRRRAAPRRCCRRRPCPAGTRQEPADPLQRRDRGRRRRRGGDRRRDRVSPG